MSLSLQIGWVHGNSFGCFLLATVKVVAPLSVVQEEGVEVLIASELTDCVWASEGLTIRSMRRCGMQTTDVGG